MDEKMKVIIAIIVSMVLVSAWAPWISEEYVRERLKTYPSFIEEHGGPQNAAYIADQTAIHRMPFGMQLATHEASYFVTFWGEVKRGFTPLPSDVENLIFELLRPLF